jgi:vancomycin resistance protein YoaR
MPSILRRSPDPSPWTPSRVALWLALALAAALALLWLFPAAYARTYADRIYPGVTLVGQPLGGLNEAEATEKIAEMPAFGGPIVLRDPEDGRSWPLDPAELGLAASLDPASLARQALCFGRDEYCERRAGLFVPLRVRRVGYDLVGLIDFPEVKAREALESLAPEVEVPPQNARIEEEDGRRVSLPARPGRVLDVEASLANLSAWTTAPVTDTIDLALGYTAARVTQVGNVTDAYNLILSAPLELYWREGQRFELSVEQLGEWTRLEDIPNDEGDRIPSIIIDRGAIREWLAPLSSTIDHPGSDARFVIDPASGLFTISSEGNATTRLDVDASIDRIIEAAYTEQRVGELAVDLRPTPVRTDALRELNATAQELRRFSVGFAGSPAGRLRNLLALTTALDGLTLAPGQEFSFLDQVGPISEEAGFDMLQLLGGFRGAESGSGSAAAEPAAGAPDTPPSQSDEAAAPATSPPPAPPIEAGLTGGVAQMATLFFRSAFWLGLPITERHAPPLRIGWLEPPIGLDASVFPGENDLRFVNDSEGFLIFDLELDSDRSVLTLVVFGRPSLDRSVEMIGPSVRDIEPAGRPASLRDDRLPARESAQIGWAREGATVAVERRVQADGVERPIDRFASRYAPAGDLIVIGTGANR